jgi:hypothetical protein
VPKVKGTKMTITCFGPVFIGLKMGFPILFNYGSSRRSQVHLKGSEVQGSGLVKVDKRKATLNP